MNLTLRQVWIAAAILGALGAAVLLNRVLATDKKRVQRIVESMAGAAGRGDVDGVFSHISSDYRGGGLSRKELRSVAESFFASHGSLQVRVRWVSLSVSGGSASGAVSVFAVAGKEGWAGSSLWTIQLRKGRDGVWSVTRIVPERFGDREVRGWRDVLERF